MRKLPVLAALLCAPVFAQIEQANITGIVTDATGAGVPEALVAAINTNTKVRAETKTNSTGAYRIPFLGAGQYELVAEKSGFDRHESPISGSPSA